MWYRCPQYAKAPRPDGLWNPWRTIGTFPPPPHKFLVLSLGRFGLSSVGVFAASPKIIQDKEAIRPEHNNYDGRNYITE